jgi:xylan 1,4-beta-xylosidase
VVIANPVLRGSHPDPCIVRVGADCYLATSTFEWWPGVRLHHSRDLVHWRPVGHALDRPDQLDLRGVPDSGGVWAPGLSHDGRRFHLVYSVVTLRERWPVVGLASYLVSAERVEGPWSAPRFLNGSGWDPSLFHDADGRCWLVNVRLDLRPGRAPMAGIVIQELDLDGGQLVGPVHLLFPGTALGCTEGPHLYRRQGHYLLVTAEGGTSWNHAVTVARAPSLDAPFVPDPAGPLLTSAGDPELPLQKAGHGSLVEMPDGSWYLAHLCARPLGARRRSVLGRETALQRVTWTDDGWPRLAGGGNRPRVEVPAPEVAPAPWPPPPTLDDFDAPALGPCWSTLRAPPDESWLTLRARPSHLRLRGRAPLPSRHDQSLVARPLTSTRAVVETVVDAEPRTIDQAAGLVCIYDTRDLIALQVTWDEELGKCLRLLRIDGGRHDEPAAPIPLPPAARCFLRARFADEELTFAWSADGRAWRSMGGPLDATQLSDEHGGKDGFTGAFVGLAAQDPGERRLIADFDLFRITV